MRKKGKDKQQQEGIHRGVISPKRDSQTKTTPNKAPVVFKVQQTKKKKCQEGLKYLGLHREGKQPNISP